MTTIHAPATATPMAWSPLAGRSCRARQPLTRPALAQRGFALIFALIVLVAMALAAVGLVRSVNTGSIVAGNLAFRQDATVTADRATQIAIDYLYGRLSDNIGNLDNHSAGAGYYASLDTNLDPTGNAYPAGHSRHASRNLIAWDSDYCATFGAAGTNYSSCSFTPREDVVDINGNTASYIVFRLCNGEGSPASSTGVNCAMSSDAFMAVSCYQGALSYENPGRDCATSPDSAPYFFRILVRTVGPRNTVSYTETLVHF